MNPILTTVLTTLLGFLGEMLIAFIRNLAAARADDDDFLQVVQRIVEGVQADHPDAPADDKWQLAFDATKNEAARLGKDVKDSLINTLIELAVQRVKARQPA